MSQVVSKFMNDLKNASLCATSIKDVKDSVAGISRVISERSNKALFAGNGGTNFDIGRFVDDISIPVYSDGLKPHDSVKLPCFSIEVDPIEHDIEIKGKTGQVDDAVVERFILNITHLPGQYNDFMSGFAREVESEVQTRFNRVLTKMEGLKNSIESDIKRVEDAIPEDKDIEIKRNSVASKYLTQDSFIDWKHVWDKTNQAANPVAKTESPVL